MKAFSHINIGEKISFIIRFKNNLILVISKKRIFLEQVVQEKISAFQALVLGAPNKTLCKLHKFLIG